MKSNQITMRIEELKATRALTSELYKLEVAVLEDEVNYLSQTKELTAKLAALKGTKTNVTTKEIPVIEYRDREVEVIKYVDKEVRVQDPALVEENARLKALVAKLQKEADNKEPIIMENGDTLAELSITKKELLNTQRQLADALKLIQVNSEKLVQFDTLKADLENKNIQITRLEATVAKARTEYVKLRDTKNKAIEAIQSNIVSGTTFNPAANTPVVKAPAPISTKDEVAVDVSDSTTDNAVNITIAFNGTMGCLFVEKDGNKVKMNEMPAMQYGSEKSAHTSIAVSADFVKVLKMEAYKGATWNLSEDAIKLLMRKPQVKKIINNMGHILHVVEVSDKKVAN